MKKLGYWGKHDVCVRCGQYIYNISIWLDPNRSNKTERPKEELQICIYETSLAAIALGEATAKAVQRIPDAHCNGDMHAALDYASKVKHAQREVVSRCGIKSIVE